MHIAHREGQIDAYLHLFCSEFLVWLWEGYNLSQVVKTDAAQSNNFGLARDGWTGLRRCMTCFEYRLPHGYGCATPARARLIRR